MKVLEQRSDRRERHLMSRRAISGAEQTDLGSVLPAEVFASRRSGDVRGWRGVEVI